MVVKFIIVKGKGKGLYIVNIFKNRIVVGIIFVVVLVNIELINCFVY